MRLITVLKKTILPSIKLFDLITFFTVFILALLLIFGPERGDGKISRLVLISGDNETALHWENRVINIYDITGKHMLVEVKDGRARVMVSDCPDKRCVKSGWVYNCGQVAACLPNKIALMIQCVTPEEALEKMR